MANNKGTYVPEDCGIFLTRKDGFVLMCDSQGEIIPGQVSTEVRHEVDAFATVTVKFYVSGWVE